MTSITIEVEVTKNGIGLHASPAIYTGEDNPTIQQAEKMVISAVGNTVDQLFQRIIAEMGKRGTVEAVQIDGYDNASALVDMFTERLRKKS